MAEEADNHPFDNYEPLEAIGGLTTLYEYYNTYVKKFILYFQNQDYDNADLFSEAVFNEAAQIIEYHKISEKDTVTTIQKKKKIYLRSAEVSYHLYQALPENGLPENRRKDIINRTINALQHVARSFWEFSKSKYFILDFAYLKLQETNGCYRKIDNISNHYKKYEDRDKIKFRRNYIKCKENIELMITKFQEIEQEAIERVANEQAANEQQPANEQQAADEQQAENVLAQQLDQINI